jgi:hypothetical protein
MLPPSSGYNKPNSADCYLLLAGFLFGIFFCNSVQFFIYLCDELTSQWPITLSSWKQYKNKISTRKKQTKTIKLNVFNLFVFKRKFLKKKSVDLETAFAAETSSWRAVAEGATEHNRTTNVPNRNTNAAVSETGVQHLVSL